MKDSKITNEELEKRITRCIIWICLFFGISSFMLIGDYVNLPHTYEIDNYSPVVEYFNAKYVTVYPDYWEISVGDGKITNIEHIIIMIFMLWGFLRVIDLLRFMEKYKTV